MGAHEDTWWHMGRALIYYCGLVDIPLPFKRTKIFYLFEFILFLISVETNLARASLLGANSGCSACAIVLLLLSGNPISLSSLFCHHHHCFVIIASLYHLCHHHHRVSIITIVSSKRSSCRYDPPQLFQQELLEISLSPCHSHTATGPHMINSTQGNWRELMWCTQATTSYKMTMCHNCSSSNVLEIFTQPMSQPQPRTTIVAPNCYNMIQFNSWQSKATHVMHASHKIHILNIPWSAFTILKGRIFIEV